MTQTWIKCSTDESKYGGEIIFYKSEEQLRGYPRMLKTVVTDADHQIVKVQHRWYNPEIRKYQTAPCGVAEWVRMRTCSSTSASRSCTSTG